MGDLGAAGRGLYPAVRWFAALKQRRRDITWLKYL
jgi:hypothetical protein